MIDRQYGQLLKDILVCGDEVQSRNSKTWSLVNYSVTLRGTPLISARKTAWRNAIREFEWFMSGSTNINDLHPAVHSWWAPWADPSGEVANSYGKQFRHVESGGFVVDQIAHLINIISKDAGSRRAVMTTWNAADMANPETPITNCHGSLTQFYVRSNKLQMATNQRSCDMLLGVPHNWIQYYAFLLYMAKQTGRDVGSLTWTGGDCHIYESHRFIAERIASVAVNWEGKTPELIYDGKPGDPFKASDFRLAGEYSPVITERPELIV